MVPGYVIIIIFVVIFYYASTNENTQFAATTSAIRQIWSGGCRLSCRPSSLSGLSGLERPACQAGTSRDDCVCETCPCAMIENVLRTCSPATQIYTNITETLSHYYYNILKSAVEAYEYAARVLECGTACQRQAQVTKKSSSSDNFSYKDQNNEMNPETSTKMPKFIRSAIDITKLALASKKSSISFKEPLKSDSSSDEKVSSGDKVANEVKGSGESSKKSNKSKDSDETLKPQDSSGNCSRCVEKGKTCISECPRAKKH